MGERLMEKLARLGAEAGIKQMTPEIYKFSMLVRADTVEQWPQREWVDLTDEERDAITDKVIGFNSCCGWEDDYAKAIEAKLKERNA